MTLREALSWCQDNCINIFFETEPGRSYVRAERSDDMYVEDQDLVTAVDRLKQLVDRSKKEDRNVDKTPLEALKYEGRNCRGRLLRMAKAIRVRTVGDLLEWAKSQPRGLQEITDYRNIGDQSLASLIDALRDHGVGEIPLGGTDNPYESDKMAA
jgi:hypothetical protein